LGRRVESALIQHLAERKAEKKFDRQNLCPMKLEALDA
jgi:hypothetical protein